MLSGVREKLPAGGTVALAMALSGRTSTPVRRTRPAQVASDGRAEAGGRVAKRAAGCGRVVVVVVGAMVVVVVGGFTRAAPAGSPPIRNVAATTLATDSFR